MLQGVKRLSLTEFQCILCETIYDTEDKASRCYAGDKAYSDKVRADGRKKGIIFNSDEEQLYIDQQPFEISFTAGEIQFLLDNMDYVKETHPANERIHPRATRLHRSIHEKYDDALLVNLNKMLKPGHRLAVEKGANGSLIFSRKQEDSE